MAAVFWDEIETIEYLNPEDLDNCEYVYDFSVEDVETFATKEGLIVHNTLNTFHYSGVSSKSNVNQGVPRIVELISATKKPKTPSLTVYLQDKYNKKDKAKEILNNIENSNLSYFIDSTSIWYDSDIMNSCIEEDVEFVKENYQFYQDVEFNQLSPWLLRIKINPLYLLNKGMTMYEIYTVLLQKYNKKKIHIIYSDENSKNLVFHLRFIHNDIDEVDSEGYLVTSNDYKYLSAIEEDIASNCVLKGLSKIERVTMREIKQTKIKKDGTIDETKKEIVLDTTGTNLQDILMLGDIVNQSKTISNDLHEVYDMLGVEAARELLKEEILGVLNHSGIYVNARHVELLADSMTTKGGLISMDRHGINKTDAGTLAKASFEEPHEHFVKGALFNKTDNMKSITSNIIMGQIGKFGTGICQIVFDDKKLEKYAYKNQIQQEQKRKTICLKKKN
jgi:DNA-directed RNA polymerase II subunit RPB1